MFFPFGKQTQKKREKSRENKKKHKKSFRRRLAPAKKVFRDDENIAWWRIVCQRPRRFACVFVTSLSVSLCRPEFHQSVWLFELEFERR